MDEARLKLAVQKSGRLTDPSLELLARCGLKLSRSKDQLMVYGENMPFDVLFVRDDDIPDLVQEDVCDLGLVGRNVLEEKRLQLQSRGVAAAFDELNNARLMGPTCAQFGPRRSCVAIERINVARAHRRARWRRRLPDCGRARAMRR